MEHAAIPVAVICGGPFRFPVLVRPVCMQRRVPRPRLAESAGDRHSSQLPKSGSGVVSGTCVGMAGFFLFFPTFSQIFYLLTNVLSRTWMGLKRRFDERPKFLGEHWNHGTLPP